MQIVYRPKTDVLCIRLDDAKQEVLNQRVAEDVVLDLGREEKIMGLESLEASAHLNLKKSLPVEYQKIVAGVNA